MAAVEIPKANAISSLPNCFISARVILEGYLSWEKMRIKKKTKVVRAVTKYDTKLDIFLAVA